MRRGFIQLHRQILDSDVFADEGLFHTFIMLLLKCNWKPGKFKGETIDPGQMVFAWRELPERLQGPMVKPLSIGTLRKRLLTMQDLGTITLEDRKRFSVLTITNWSKYQKSIVSEPVSKTDTMSDTITDTMSDTDIRRSKKGKNKSSTSTHVDGSGRSKGRQYSPKFEQWWSHYPRKVGKPSASKAFSKALQRIATERRLSDVDALAWLISRTDAYATSVADKAAQHIKHPGPWLNDDRFNDEHEAETDSPATIRFNPKDAL